LLASRPFFFSAAVEKNKHKLKICKEKVEKKSNVCSESELISGKPPTTKTTKAGVTLNRKGR